MAYVGFIVIFVAYMAWQEHKFNKMSPAAHLAAAKAGSIQNGSDRQDMKRHLEAIPKNAQQAGQAIALREQIDDDESRAGQEYELRAQANNARASAIVQLGKDLKDLGYELSVEASPDTWDEIIITSTELGDTDHRVRFLSFMRGRNAPTGGLCGAGLTKLRLKSSTLPLVGFNELYSLSCS